MRVTRPQGTVNGTGARFVPLRGWVGTNGKIDKMRQGPHPKRGRGRSNGRRTVNTRNQNIDSAGPGLRVRGNAVQVHEKYLQLARDAAAIGDTIAAENYSQHAEHYYRIMSAYAQSEERSGAVRHDDATAEGADGGTSPNGQGAGDLHLNGEGDDEDDESEAPTQTSH